MLMHAFMRTPVGRMCNAVRDNPERAEFVGYNTQRVRFIAFAVAGLFAGLAGGLHAINYEIVAADAVSAQRSGTVLIMAYIGGAAHFVGPVLGAIVDHVAAEQPERLHVGVAALSRPVLHRDHPVRAGGPRRADRHASADRAHARVRRRARRVRASRWCRSRVMRRGRGAA